MRTDNTPIPDLRIVPAESLLPHEDHDPQRSRPLIERLRNEDHIINPPIVTPIEQEQYIILDGANRCHAFHALGYPHMIVQVVDYNQVELHTWNHIISDWHIDQFINSLNAIPGLTLLPEYSSEALAHVIFDLGREQYALHTNEAPNRLLRAIVQLYQQNATLNRTSIQDVWSLYPAAIAMLIFQSYQPADIIAAAKQQDYLPPGISRHIVHGRVLRINYPIKQLRDEQVSLDEKNRRLHTWFQEKLAQRQVRYYAEDTYQFDE